MLALARRRELGTIEHREGIAATDLDIIMPAPIPISHGQGHETMYKILLSHRLGLDEADIRVAHSDTDLAPDGGGTYASRTAVLGGSAATIAADKIIEGA